MQNYKIEIAYDGSRYQGWQRLGQGQTIQGKIEDVLTQMLQHKVEIHGAGRTDAGVHARAQIAHFKMKTDSTPQQIQAYLNRYLPKDIAITKCEMVDMRFHARLNTVGKRYVYRIWNSDISNVFERKQMCQIEQPLCVQSIRQGAQYLIGKHDFKAFCGNKKMKKSTVRTLHKLEVVQQGKEIQFQLEGTGFLQNMVRILVGTLVEVGLGKRTPQDVLRVLESLDRAQAGITMPPQGLCLEQVFY